MAIATRARLAAAAAADADVDAAAKAGAGPDPTAPAGPTYFVADTASDMWQVGVVAWLLLTGRPLFGGDTSDEQARRGTPRWDVGWQADACCRVGPTS
jgi:hypothetical protein